MKIKISVFTVFLLVLVGFFFACEKEPKTEYPIEVPFTEYLLIGTSCQWVNLNYDDKIIIINSAEELRSYIDCSDGNYPEIDFAKKSLLMAKGMSDSGISNSVIKALMQFEHDHYELGVELEFNNLPVETPWQVSIVVDKIDMISVVDLKTKYIH